MSVMTSTANETGAPANSYVAAAEAWDLEEMLTGDCTEESAIVGYSTDGYPIKGPCVCMARDGEGTCTDVRRVMSSWVYEGLGAWEEESELASGTTFEFEGIDCTSNEDCDNEDSWCAFALTDTDGEVTVRRQCTLIDYGWCSHRYRRARCCCRERNHWDPGTPAAAPRNEPLAGSRTGRI